MDCSTCRSLFSQSFDERLAGERRQAFVLHLQACQPCDSEFTLYRRVFSTIRDLPDGEALPFKAPAEVPGSLTQFQAPSAPPRFARIAASILILIGLLGTHVLVFQWSRDHASRVDAGRAAPPVLTTTPSMNAVLPSALRDHVDATDLLMRTLEKLPDDRSARDVAAADWAVSRLPELTEELRRLQFDAPPEIRPLVKQYLEDAGSDFVPRMKSAIENRRASVSEIRNHARMSSIRSTLGQMKLVVAALPRGTSFGCEPDQGLYDGLAADGRRLIKSKYARLAGQLSQAIQGVERFDTEFPQSSLKPAATYLAFDAYNTAGLPGEAWSLVSRSGCVEFNGPTPVVITQLRKWVELQPRIMWVQQGKDCWPDEFHFEGRLPNGQVFGVGIRSSVLKSEAAQPIRPVDEAPESRHAPK